MQEAERLYPPHLATFQFGLLPRYVYPSSFLFGSELLLQCLLAWPPGRSKPNLIGLISFLDIKHVPAETIVCLSESNVKAE